MRLALYIARQDGDYDLLMEVVTDRRTERIDNQSLHDCMDEFIHMVLGSLEADGEEAMIVESPLAGSPQVLEGKHNLTVVSKTDPARAE